MNIFGTNAVFPGLGVDGQNITPTPGTSVFRVDPTSSKLQLSNNGSAFLDVNSGNSGKSVVAGTNVIVTDDGSGNWVVSTNSNPTFTSVTTTGSITAGGPLNAASGFFGGNLTASNITTSGTLTSNRLSVNDTTNTANIIMSTLSNSGTADPNFKICAARPTTDNFPGATVQSFGMFHSTTPNAIINFHRGSSSTDGYMSFATSNTNRMTIEANGVINVMPRNSTVITFFDSAATPASTRNIYLGHSAVANNSGVIRYSHDGVGVSTNRMSLGMYQTPTTLTLSTTDCVGIRKNAPAYPLDVTGDIALTGSIINAQSLSPSSSSPSSYTVEFKNNSETSTGGLKISPWVDDRCLMSFVGTSNHNIRSRINSVDNTTFMTINNNGVTHDYFVLGVTNLNTSDGAMRMRAGVPEVRMNGVYRPLRPLTGIITVSYTAGTGSIYYGPFVGDAVATLLFNRINLNIPDFDCLALITTLQIMDVTVIAANVGLVATPINSSNIRISLLSGGAVTGFNTIGDFTMNIGYMIA